MKEMVLKKCWVRKNSEILENQDLWQESQEQNIAEEIIQLIIDELTKLYELQGEVENE